MDTEGTGYICFHQFVTIAVAKSRDIDLEEELKDTFQYISSLGGGKMFYGCILIAFTQYKIIKKQQTKATSTKHGKERRNEKKRC